MSPHMYNSSSMVKFISCFRKVQSDCFQLADSFLPHGDSGTQALSIVWLQHLPYVVYGPAFLISAKLIRGKNMGGHVWGHLKAQAWEWHVSMNCRN